MCYYTLFHFCFSGVRGIQREFWGETVNAVKFLHSSHVSEKDQGVSGAAGLALRWLNSRFFSAVVVTRSCLR